MTASRIFLSQEALDAWIGEGRADVQGDVLTDAIDGRRFQLAGGVRFLSEVTGAGDASELVGRVKDLAQLAELGGEHMADSVILGELAYEVQQGFVGRALTTSAEASAMKEATLPVIDAKPAAEALQQQRQTLVALQAFFLNNVK